MAFQLTRDNIRLTIRIGLFVLLVGVIVLLYPREKQFKYQYDLGKPWNYELLTATFDFPIYKTDEQLKRDKEELLANYVPYFQIDTRMADHQLEKWLNARKILSQDAPRYIDYVRRKFDQIYKQGVVSSSTFERFQSEKLKSIAVIHNDRRTSIVSLEDVYTPKTAYEEIIYSPPSGIDVGELSAYNLNLYLTENLRYDSITSANVKEDMLKNISLTSGMVQTGEKIINRGEIITPASYAILNSLKIEMDKKTSLFRESSYVVLGEIIIVFGLIMFLCLYLYLFRPNIFEETKNLVFIALLIFLMIGLTTIVQKFTDLGVYIVPYALLPIIIRVFFDSRTALFVHMITVLILAFMVDNPFIFILIQMTAGMTAVSGLKDLTSRSQLTQTAIMILVCYVLMYVAAELISEGDIARVNYTPLIYLSISSLLSLFAYVLIYLFEKMFNLISAITLVELTNINSDLMIRFAEKAPGTFQHSLQVSNLATEAAKTINANSLLVRTGALYHDIGKMIDPQYFIENQIPGENPLLEMSYEDAAQAVIKHVADGVVLAKKHRLPEQIIGFITTHHGRTKTKFFYNSFVNENPGVKPDDEKFTYPGPLPFSKETAILMMADAVEARSRTLTEYSEKSISDMVESMIDSQIADGQFKKAPISFKDVESVKKVLTEKIKNIYHSRISYPELNGNSSTEAK